MEAWNRVEELWEVGEMWLDAGFALKVEPTGLANRPHSLLFLWLQELLHTHTLAGACALTARLS